MVNVCKMMLHFVKIKVLMPYETWLEPAEKQDAIAYCLLPIACCLLSIACFLLPVANCLLLMHLAMCLKCTYKRMHKFRAAYLKDLLLANSFANSFLSISLLLPL